MAQQDVLSPTVFLGCYVKRFSASLGLNTTPTSVDLELVPGYGNIAEDIANSATGFRESEAAPGSFGRLQVGAFDFAGIIQSWNKSYGPDGLTYNVRLVDPRPILDNIPVVLGYGVIDSTSSYTNVLDAIRYYGNPKDLGLNDVGTQWSKIKTFLQNSNINIYGKNFNLSFSSRFSEGTGVSSNLDVPPWYRIKSSVVTLNQLIQQVANDHNFDYYLYIDTSGFVASSGTGGTLQLGFIDRNASTNLLDLQTIINQAQSSGTLQNYRLGQELRSDPTNTVITGPNLTYWAGANSAGSNSVCGYWGRTADGSALFNMASVTGGFVLLDNITGSGVDNMLTLFRIDYTKTTLTQTYTQNAYPPSFSITNTTTQTTGYFAHPIVLRAALFNRLSWEAMMKSYHAALAYELYIDEYPIRTAFEFAALLQSNSIVAHNVSLAKINANPPYKRDLFQEAIVDAVYERTKAVAEEFYGKKYVVKIDGYSSLFTSDWLDNTTFFSADAFPQIEYNVVDAAWSEYNGSMPTSVSNHVLLNQTNLAAFKDNRGRLKSFISYPHYNSTGFVFFPYKIDTSVLPPNETFIEQGNKLCLPIQVEQYEKQPNYAIVTVPYLVQEIIDPTGDVNISMYREFLNEMGYNNAFIDYYNLLKDVSESIEFGLAPARFLTVESSPGNYGIHFPVEFKTKKMNTWQSNGARPGPVNIINDQDLAPWSFGSYNNTQSAGLQTAAKTNAQLDTIDSAELTLAGLPIYNIHSIINNANITAINYSYGQDGLSTSYSLRTFALPAQRLSKLLSDKIASVYNKNQKIEREIINIDKIAIPQKRTEGVSGIYKPSQIANVFGTTFGTNMVGIVKGANNSGLIP